MNGCILCNSSGSDDNKPEILLFTEQCFDIVSFESSSRLHCQFLWKASKLPSILFTALNCVAGK